MIECTTFLKSQNSPEKSKEHLFCGSQESAKKFIERFFAILQGIIEDYFNASMSRVIPRCADSQCLQYFAKYTYCNAAIRRSK